MEGTQCPICGKHLTGTVEETTHHVNLCIDNSQSLDLIGNLFTNELNAATVGGTRKFGYCPVCYKLTGVTAQHIKSCGKSKGIETKELIVMCAPDPMEDFGKKGKGGKKGNQGKTKKELDNNPFGPGCTKECDADPKKASNGGSKLKQPTEFLFKPTKPSQAKKLIAPKEKKPRKTKPKVTAVRKGKVNSNQLILQPSKSGLILKMGKPIGISKGELFKLSEEEKQEIIKKRIENILSNTIHPNNCISTYFQTDLPVSWTKASLTCSKLNFIVEGFERFCSIEKFQESPTKCSDDIQK
ncbi:uncharacterized protein LOC128391803 [Panonychus citri]|uniref:uncharacterized protein LOC128391803 n=1 Tax=Panonychus citri TaxID=50023 RepID=UPI002307C80B|nr:uncharacterized protein LOC128391803 [Panonychus citri]